MATDEQASGIPQDMDIYELERVWTHREEDRTRHIIVASSSRAAESRLKNLERAGETDDAGEEIKSQGLEPLHTHVNEAWNVDESEVEYAE